jgi:DNA replication regulator SLD3
MSDLVSFLESLILSNSVIEKKYRDGVPTCVSTIDVHDSGIDANDGSLKVKKRKSTKRVKPGRNGLYPSEDGLIRKWWLEHDDDGDSGVPGSTREEVAKNRISQLRIRETQLQLIVILEVLTLQPLASQKEEKGDDLPSTIPISDKSQATEKHMKQKKPENLSMVIDIHIDRLCIWQSIQAEHTKVPNAESQSAHSSTLTTGSKHTDNILRDFCVEVIAPL